MMRWQLLACQVLPGLAVAAAMRPNRLAAGLAHSPCSQLHARLAGDITASAGRLLPYRFSPDPHQQMPITGGNAFCCGCSHLA